MIAHARKTPGVQCRRFKAPQAQTALITPIPRFAIAHQVMTESPTSDATKEAVEAIATATIQIARLVHRSDTWDS
jgi:hypothetical protein